MPGLLTRSASVSASQAKIWKSTLGPNPTSDESTSMRTDDNANSRKSHQQPRSRNNPRPVRMDAEDGPWSVSVTENHHNSRSYTIYVKTPTHHLTLTRSANEISDLHIKLSDAHPSTALPTFPFDHPPKRRSNFLHTLSRLASSKPAPPPSPSPEFTPDPFAVDPQQSGPSTSTSIAAYLTSLSNHPVFRATRQWKRFVRVRTDDLESIRVERTIKRARSDMAVRAAAVPSISDASSDLPSISTHDKASVAAYEDDEDANFIADHNFLAAHLNGSMDLPDLPVAAAAAVPLPEPTKDEVDPTWTKPEHPDTDAVLPLNENSADSIIPETQTAESETQPESESAIHPHARIPRSVSADPDKAARLSRVWQPSPLNQELASETEGEESERGGAMTDGGVVRRKKKKVKKVKLERQSKKVVVDDFEMMRVLGKGCAGKVLLVRHRASESLYALKAITKRHVLAHQELQHTLTEQAVLKRMARESRDPFVVKLWWSFHDKENLFLVMDFHPGGDLATQLARWGRLGRDRARFYAAEIVEGVEGLHAAGVIYRDLKPENILIGGDGHIVLTDFGLSKEFPRRGSANSTPGGGSTDDFYSSNPATSVTARWTDPSDPSWSSQTQNDTTSTFCGTAEYLAPEVIQGLPYSYQVDWWSFGTMLYEMLTGITPFWANNHSDMYVRVLQDELTFPEDKALDQDTKSLIRGLLQRNPALRMSEPRIKRHPYFSMIDWSHVYHKRYIPPYIPPIDPSNASDTQNFDDAFLDMDPTLDNEPETQTESERGKADTDSERTDGPGSTKSSVTGQSRSPAPRNFVHDDSVDVFDGYSFKGRHSVILDDDDDDEGYEGVDEGEDDTSSEIKDQDLHNEPPDPVTAEQVTTDQEQKVSSSPSTPVQQVSPLPPSPEIEETPVVVEKQLEEELHPVSAKDAATLETVLQPPTAQTPQTDSSIQSPVVSDATSPIDTVMTPDSAYTSTTILNTPVDATGILVEVIQKPVVPLAKPGPSKLSKLKSKAPTPVTPVTVRPQPRSKREKSGVPALDRKVTEDEETATEKDDDDWDLVETPGAEEMNGSKGSSLFARGVVDRYRLAFRKTSGQASRVGGRSFSGMSEASPSPTPSDKLRRGRAGGISLRKSTNKFLRARSPPAPFSAPFNSNRSPALTHSGSMAASVPSGLLTPSTSAPLGISTASSLKSKPSTTSMSPGSSDTSMNGEPSILTQAGVDLPSPTKLNGIPGDLTKRTLLAASSDDHEKHKKMKKMKKYTEQGAEKVLSLFSSPRQQQQQQQ